MARYRRILLDNTPRYVQETPDGEFLLIKGELLGPHTTTTQQIPSNHKVLAPITPPAIFCIGLNYRQHAEEMGVALPERPIVFMKSVNALHNPGKAIELPRKAFSGKVDYEGELAVVISRACKNVSVGNALEYVLGYSCANDVSARDWQNEWGGGQWCRGKSFDGFCPLGPTLVTTEDIPEPNSLALKTLLNGVVVQQANTSDMIFGVAELISFLSQSTTLFPGSLILTGTPSGVGAGRKPPLWLKAGDQVTVEIETIGTLTNPVIEESC